jgi:hypothetical protein
MSPTLKRRGKTDENEVPVTVLPPSTPTFNPQLPLSQMTTPSFLNENLQANITSPTPHQDEDTTPIFNNADLEALLHQSDEDMMSITVDPERQTSDISSL